MCKIWEHVPNRHTTLGTQKFRNILLFENKFGNIDFGITHCFDSQGPKLGGQLNLIVVLTLRTAN